MLVDRAKPLPLYYQIKEAVKREIEDNKLAPDTLLPSDNEVASRYGGGLCPSIG